MRIRGTFRYMASNEIRMMIAPGVISEITKRGDPHPVFKAFVIGHEGVAQGFLVGVGNIVKKWYRSAIEMLYNKIDIGIRLFHGHGETNDQGGRTPIGEVVGKKLDTVANRLSTIVACYIYPQFRNLPLDVASIEADIDLDESKDGLFVVNVNEVSGIALANKAVEKPGFPGATLLGQLQAFAKIKNLEGKSMLSLDEVRSFLRDEGLKPSDVFTPSELTSDPHLSGIFKEAGKEEFGERWRRKAESMEEAAAEKRKEEAAALKKKHEEEIRIRDERIRALAQDVTRTKIPAIFDKKAAERKFDETQIRFIKARLPKFVPPDKPEELETALDKHLDTEVDEYNVIAKDVFKIAGEKKDEPTPGREPIEGQGAPSPEDKFFDPANSPLV